MSNTFKTIGDLIREIQTAPTEPEKVILLRRYDCPHLRDLLRLQFDPARNFALKRGPVVLGKHVPDAIGMIDLRGEWNRIKRLYLDGPNTTRMPDDKREALFLRMLTALDPYEAAILIDVKNKELSGIPESAVRTAYPDLLPTRSVEDAVVDVPIVSVATKKSTKAKTTKKKNPKKKVAEVEVAGE